MLLLEAQLSIVKSTNNAAHLIPRENSAPGKLWHTHNITFLAFSLQIWSIPPLRNTVHLLFVKQEKALWVKARARSGTKNTATRGKPSPRNTRSRRAEALGAAVPSAVCRPGTVWWAPSAAGRFRSPASSPFVERASACGCVSLSLGAQRSSYCAVTSISCSDKHEQFHTKPSHLTWANEWNDVFP